jgi:hypothetical protein
MRIALFFFIIALLLSAQHASAVLTPTAFSYSSSLSGDCNVNSAYAVDNFLGFSCTLPSGTTNFQVRSRQ